jgi:glyoxylase-like metal-dependent hydrolase (beta-lactamase superfamily II)
MIMKGRAAWSPPADRLLDDGDAIDVGSWSFEVIHTPGHTPGGICLKYKKTLFTGDTLMAGTVGRTDMKYASWNDISASIQDKLFVLSDDIICYPGHGPKTTIERERAGNIFVRHSPETLDRFFFEMEKRTWQQAKERKEEKKS